MTRLRALFQEIKALSDPTTRLEALRTITNADVQERDEDTAKRGHRVLYATPERDEIKPSSVHLWSDNDILALALKRDAEQKAQPPNIRAFVRSVKS